MFIADELFALLRSSGARYALTVLYIPLLTERNKFGNSGYKHLAPLEQRNR